MIEHLVLVNGVDTFLLGLSDLCYHICTFRFEAFPIHNRQRDKDWSRLYWTEVVKFSDGGLLIIRCH